MSGAKESGWPMSSEKQVHEGERGRRVELG